LLSRTIHHDRKLEMQEWKRGKEWKGREMGMGNENTETAIITLMSNFYVNTPP